MFNLSQIEDRYGVRWQFSTARYTIAFWAEEEDLRPEDAFEFAGDVAFAKEDDFAHWFCAFVGIFDADGTYIAHDCLGGCSYNSFEEFCGGRTGWRKGAKLTAGGYFEEMVRECIARARSKEILNTMVAA